MLTTPCLVRHIQFVPRKLTLEQLPSVFNCETDNAGKGGGWWGWAGGASLGAEARAQPAPQSSVTERMSHD